MKPDGQPVISSDSLDSWKAIAAYLKRDERTVLRWERDRGLPVHRIPGGGKPGVYALKSELDSWWKDAGTHPPDAREKAVRRPRTPSVAVLPFVNLSAEKENEYFSDGLADEIITELTRIHGLRVTARTSSFAFRDRNLDVREIGKALGVSTLLEGSVQRTGSRVRISAQLVGTGDGFHLWSECYDRDIADVFAIQDEISRAIAAALEVRLSASRTGRPTSNPEAYNFWLKGRYYLQYETVEALAKCKACLDRAIELDSQFPQPYVALAELYRAAAHFGTVRPRDALSHGEAAIRRALELDSTLGEAHAMCGAYRAWMHFDWKGAEFEFDRALELAPGSEPVHRMRATHYLVPTNQLREAEDEMARAVESDPLSPLACIELGKVLLWERQFDRAQAIMKAAFDLRPDYALAVWYRGAALYFQGRIEEAVSDWQSSLAKIGPNLPMRCAIGMGLGQLGRSMEARAVLTEVEDAGRSHFLTPVGLAQIHLGLGEIDAVFHWLHRAVEDRDVHILVLPCKPIWDGIREDSRFVALLHEMRLA